MFGWYAIWLYSDFTSLVSHAHEKEFILVRSAANNVVKSFVKFSICCAGWSGVARRGVGCERFAPWPWEAVCQQTQRWMRAGCFEAIVHDLWEMLRICDGRKAQPSAIILDSRILQSTPQSGARAGYDSAKRRKSFKIHLPVNMLGQLLALHVTLANEQDRAQVEQLARAIQLRRRTTLSTLV